MARLGGSSLSRSLRLATLGVIGAGAFVLGAQAQTPASTSLTSMQKNPDNWVMPTGTYNNWRYSPLKQINTNNVKNMQVAWSMSTGTDRGLEGQPIVIGNMMYYETSYPNYVYAIDLNHPDQIAWKFEPPHDSNAPPVACCDVVNRGPAFSDGMVYADALDGVLYALDAKTGKVVWQAKNAHPQDGQTMTGAPMVVGKNVIVGVAGGEYGVRGYLTAYDAKTGKQVWRAYSEGPNKDMLMSATHTINGATGKPIGAHSSIKTWQGDQWKVGEPHVLRDRQPGHVEPEPTPRQEPLVDDHHGAQPGNR
ncbi:PQQ-binding-like beta-propeller repeat protein [Acidiphilium sp. 37-64-53]|uniref:outer membrane protein assembly factor BamB family protein n=1 Tax=Acidiphilium sp. 37-64-53 TaxID=1970299 RepID=UPI00257E7AFD|nr:PQQ-binding-like beta-propeller repeat protein [Acidiphilium sp. 37-64-53]